MLGVNHFLLCSGFMRAMMGIVDFELYYVISWCYEIFMGLFIHVLVPSICLFEAVPIIFKIKFVWFALEMVRQCFVLDEWISFSLWMAYEFENVRCWPKKKKKRRRRRKLVPWKHWSSVWDDDCLIHWFILLLLCGALFIKDCFW